MYMSGRGNVITKILTWQFAYIEEVEKYRLELLDSKEVANMLKN